MPPRTLALVCLLAAPVIYLAGAAFVAADDPKPPKRVALLAGINEYKRRGFPNLQWAENDVNETAAELKRLGFDRVVVLTNSAGGELTPTKEHIETQLLKLLKEADIGKDDLVLVMLSGHGQQFTVTPHGGGAPREDAFFCPADAVLNDPVSMISLSRLTDETLHKLGGRNVVIVDACRDGIVDNDKGTKGIDGRVVALPEGTALLFSCAARQVSLERADLKHGVFTYALLDALRNPDLGATLTWTRLVDHVQEKVAVLNPKQVPISAGVIPRVVLGTRRTVLENRPAPKPEPRPDVPATVAPEVITSRSTGMKLRLIPAGEFMMGSEESDHEAVKHEMPKKKVAISRSYFLGETEVTQGQYRAFTRENPSRFKGSDFLPVETVSWLDAVKYCNALSMKDGRTPFYRISAGEASVPGLSEKDGPTFFDRAKFNRTWDGEVSVPDWSSDGYRLPTEAEWEYACRAHGTGRYGFGDDPARLEEFAWLKANSEEKPHSVRQKRANGFGLFDMQGNVSEWCWDGWSNEASGGVDPRGPSWSQSRIVRGGCWGSSPSSGRPAYRRQSKVDYRDRIIGFRVAAFQAGR